MYDLTDKVAVVTGGSSGIGRAIAQRFAREGARVLIVARKEADLKATAAGYPSISYIAADLTDSVAIQAIGSRIESAYGGGTDILVNNAGWCPVESIKDVTMADYTRAFDLDVKAVVALTSCLLPSIIKAKGTIINISSIGATHAAPGISMYIGAKAAISSFTRGRALDQAKDGYVSGAVYAVDGGAGAM